MRRSATAIAMSALLALSMSACSDQPATQVPTSTPSATTEPAPTPTQTYTEDGGAEATAPSDGDASTTTPATPTKVDVESSFLKGTRMTPDRALFTLDALVVSEPLDMQGYTEGTYSPGANAEDAGWPPQTLPARGCDVASATFARDGFEVKADEQCTITEGIWLDPFTRKKITEPSGIAPVYVVPGAEVWRSGGSRWTQEQATIYGSTQEALVAGINPKDRGDKGPEEWKPEDKSTWCPYAVRWIGVKNEFGLSLTSQEEREALREMLGTCQSGDAPVGA